jgi:formylglycine-generating enzyme required for sulfatase activity
MHNRRLLFTLFTILLLTCTNLYAAGERIALVIGNSQYQNLNTLKNPVNDARAVAQRLQALNFQLIDAKGKNTDKPVLNLKENAFAQTVSRFAKRANGAEIAFLYYAGHGMQESGTSYLLPIDAPKDDVELITRNAISLDNTLNKLDGKAQLTVAVFDACREIPNLEQTTRSAGLSPNAYRGLARLKKPGKSRIVAYAGAVGELVPDGDTQNSPYTRELIKVLQNPQGEIDNVLQRVAWNVGQTSQQQSPEISIQGVQPGRFYFNQPQQKSSAEIVFWQSVEKQPNEAGYRDYLNQYPQGIFASLAQRRLLAYQTPTPPTPPQPIVTETRQPYEPEMVSIPAGSFRMGDIQGGGDDDEKPVHTVQIKSFSMSKYEITQAQWRAVMGKKPSHYKGNDLPVENASWHDVQEFIQKLNAKTGKQYRLPSEAEWEYAARAKTTTKYWWGNEASHDYANYGTDICCAGHIEGKDQWKNTSPVGSFSANAFGLHDMHGNVWEWVQDCWHGDYKNAPTDGSVWGEANNGDCSRRVFRGGDWDGKPRNLRSAYRSGSSPDNTVNNQGFRLAREN